MACRVVTRRLVRALGTCRRHCSGVDAEFREFTRNLIIDVSERTRDAEPDVGGSSVRLELRVTKAMEQSRNYTLPYRHRISYDEYRILRNAQLGLGSKLSLMADKGIPINPAQCYLVGPLWVPRPGGHYYPAEIHMVTYVWLEQMYKVLDTYGPDPDAIADANINLGGNRTYQKMVLEDLARFPPETRDLLMRRDYQRGSPQHHTGCQAREQLLDRFLALYQGSFDGLDLVKIELRPTRIGYISEAEAKILQRVLRNPNPTQIADEEGLLVSNKCLELVASQGQRGFAYKLHEGRCTHLFLKWCVQFDPLEGTQLPSDFFSLGSNNVAKQEVMASIPIEYYDRWRDLALAFPNSVSESQLCLKDSDAVAALYVLHERLTHAHVTGEVITGDFSNEDLARGYRRIHFPLRMPYVRRWSRTPFARGKRHTRQSAFQYVINHQLPGTWRQCAYVTRPKKDTLWCCDKHFWRFVRVVGAVVQDPPELRLYTFEGNTESVAAVLEAVGAQKLAAVRLSSTLSKNIKGAYERAGALLYRSLEKVLKGQPAKEGDLEEFRRLREVILSEAKARKITERREPAPNMKRESSGDPTLLTVGGLGGMRRLPYLGPPPSEVVEIVSRNIRDGVLVTEAAVRTLELRGLPCSAQQMEHIAATELENRIKAEQGETIEDEDGAINEERLRESEDLMDLLRFAPKPPVMPHFKNSRGFPFGKSAEFVGYTKSFVQHFLQARRSQANFGIREDSLRRVFMAAGFTRRFDANSLSLETWKQWYGILLKVIEGATPDELADDCKAVRDRIAEDAQGDRYAQRYVGRLPLLSGFDERTVRAIVCADFVRGTKKSFSSARVEDLLDQAGLPGCVEDIKAQRALFEQLNGDREDGNFNFTPAAAHSLNFQRWLERVLRELVEAEADPDSDEVQSMGSQCKRLFESVRAFQLKSIEVADVPYPVLLDMYELLVDVLAGKKDPKDVDPIEFIRPEEPEKRNRASLGTEYIPFMETQILRMPHVGYPQFEALKLLASSEGSSVRRLAAFDQFGFPLRMELLSSNFFKTVRKSRRQLLLEVYCTYEPLLVFRTWLERASSAEFLVPLYDRQVSLGKHEGALLDTFQRMRSAGILREVSEMSDDELLTVYAHLTRVLVGKDPDLSTAPERTVVQNLLNNDEMRQKWAASVKELLRLGEFPRQATSGLGVSRIATQHVLSMRMPLVLPREAMRVAAVVRDVQKTGRSVGERVLLALLRLEERGLPAGQGQVRVILEAIEAGCDFRAAGSALFGDPLYNPLRLFKQWLTRVAQVFKGDSDFSDPALKCLYGRHAELIQDVLIEEGCVTGRHAMLLNQTELLRLYERLVAAMSGLEESGHVSESEAGKTLLRIPLIGQPAGDVEGIMRQTWVKPRWRCHILDEKGLPGSLAQVESVPPQGEGLDAPPRLSERAFQIDQFREWLRMVVHEQAAERKGEMRYTLGLHDAPLQAAVRRLNLTSKKLSSFDEETLLALYNGLCQSLADAAAEYAAKHDEAVVEMEASPELKRVRHRTAPTEVAVKAMRAKHRLHQYQLSSKVLDVCTALGGDAVTAEELQCLDEALSSEAFATKIQDVQLEAAEAKEGTLDGLLFNRLRRVLLSEKMDA